MTTDNAPKNEPVRLEDLKLAGLLGLLSLFAAVLIFANTDFFPKHKYLFFAGGVLASAALYGFKRGLPRYYGGSAVAIGVFTLYKAIKGWDPDELETLPHWIAVGASVYAISKGIEELLKSRDKANIT